MALPSTDTDDLARFGYKQELNRSLGLFSSLATGFSYISIMTGVFELVGRLGGVGAVYYLLAHRGRPATVLAEHGPGAAAAGYGVAGHQV
jgi:hypothetical protein